jgi:uncharacterized protein YciI
MSKAYREVRGLTAANLKKRVCLAFSYPTAPREELLPYLAEHLRYLSDREDEILLSGPIIRDGQLLEETMVVFQSGSELKAADFMRGDPFIRHGLKRFDLKTWEIRGGTLNFTAKLSESKLVLK